MSEKEHRTEPTIKDLLVYYKDLEASIISMEGATAVILYHLNTFIKEDTIGFLDGLRGCVYEVGSGEGSLEDIEKTHKPYFESFFYRPPSVERTELERTNLELSGILHSQKKDVVRGTEQFVFAVSKYYYQVFVTLIRYLSTPGVVGEAMNNGYIVDYTPDGGTEDTDNQTQFIQYLWGIVKQLEQYLHYVEVHDEVPVISSNAYKPDWFMESMDDYTQYYENANTIGEKIFLFKQQFYINEEKQNENFFRDRELFEAWLRNDFLDLIFDPFKDQEDPLTKPLHTWNDEDESKVILVRYQELRKEAFQILEVISKEYSPYLETVPGSTIELRGLFKKYGLKEGYQNFDFWCNVVISLDEFISILTDIDINNYELAKEKYQMVIKEVRFAPTISRLQNLDHRKREAKILEYFEKMFDVEEE